MKADVFFRISSQCCPGNEAGCADPLVLLDFDDLSSAPMKQLLKLMVNDVGHLLAHSLTRCAAINVVPLRDRRKSTPLPAAECFLAFLSGPRFDILFVPYEDLRSCQTTRRVVSAEISLSIGKDLAQVCSLRPTIAFERSRDHLGGEALRCRCLAFDLPVSGDRR